MYYVCVKDLLLILTVVTDLELVLIVGSNNLGS